jgi:hypothetical protein
MPAGCAILTVMTEPQKRVEPLRLAGFLLLITGWILVLAALVLLKHEASRAAFVSAGMGVETLGLVLVVRSWITPKSERAR